MNKIIEALDNIGVQYELRGNEAILDCPFKQHRHAKLWINVEKRTGICPRCNITGTARWFVKQLGGQVEEKKTIEFKFHETNHTDEIKSKIELPKECRPIDTKTFLGEEAYKYLTIKRGLEPYQISSWEIYYCSTGPYAGYIILPVKNMKGDLDSWQARKYYYNGSKSLNPKSGRGLLYGLQKCEEEDSIVLVEGPFDVIALERNLTGSVPLGLLGHSLGDLQAAVIAYVLKPKTVWIMLDWDVNEDEVKVAAKLTQYGLNDVRMCQLQQHHGDPDELSREQVKEILDKAKRFHVTDMTLERLTGNKGPI